MKESRSTLLKRAECGGAGMGALASLADRMTFRAHPFGKAPSTLFQVARRILLGEARRYSEQHERDCEPCDHFARFSAHLAIRLGVAGPFRRRSEAHRCPTSEAGERVEVRIILVRPAAQHREPAERAMLKPSRLRGHGREGRLLAQPTGVEVCPVERSGEYAKACADECEKNDLGRHRSISVWLVNATLHDLGLSDFDFDQMPRGPSKMRPQDAGDRAAPDALRLDQLLRALDGCLRRGVELLHQPLHALAR